MELGKTLPNPWSSSISPRKRCRKIPALMGKFGVHSDLCTSYTSPMAFLNYFCSFCAALRPLKLPTSPRTAEVAHPIALMPITL